MPGLMFVSSCLLKILRVYSKIARVSVSIGTVRVVLQTVSVSVPLGSLGQPHKKKQKKQLPNLLASQLASNP